MKEFLRQMTIHGAYDYNFIPLKWFIQQFVTQGERTRHKLLQLYDIDLVIDIGANYGQFAKSLLKNGYQGSILSFEPLQEPWEHLESVSRYYKNWSARKIAVGDRDETKTFNVSAVSASSSFLNMSKSHLNAAPETEYVGIEQIQVLRLDSIFTEISSNHRNIFLKIDTQGFENAVLNGARDSLPGIVGLQLEMSLEELYIGETLFQPMYERVVAMGFELCHIEEGLRNSETGKLLQVDAVFYRTDYRQTIKTQSTPKS